MAKSLSANRYRRPPGRLSCGSPDPHIASGGADAASTAGLETGGTSRTNLRISPKAPIDSLAFFGARVNSCPVTRPAGRRVCRAAQVCPNLHGLSALKRAPARKLGCHPQSTCTTPQTNPACAGRDAAQSAGSEANANGLGESCTPAGLM